MTITNSTHQRKNMNFSPVILKLKMLLLIFKERTKRILLSALSNFTQSNTSNNNKGKKMKYLLPLTLALLSTSIACEENEKDPSSNPLLRPIASEEVLSPLDDYLPVPIRSKIWSLERYIAAYKGFGGEIVALTDKGKMHIKFLSNGTVDVVPVPKENDGRITPISQTRSNPFNLYPHKNKDKYK